VRALCVVVLSGATPALGGGALPARNGIPPECERFEVKDLTLTLRDDYYSAIAADPNQPDVAYVGSFEGRVYKTVDRGLTWRESTVIPEVKSLYGFASQSVFFGSLRSAGDDLPAYDLAPEPSAPTFGAGLKYGAQIQPDESAAFRDESQRAAGLAGGVAGVGISSRAPRLSILVGSRGKPVPNLSLKKLLNDRGAHGTTIVAIFVHPSDSKTLFASTVFGLYKSYDAGVSWVRTFTGALLEERTMYGLGFDPVDRDHVLMGTSAGAYESRDGGENWRKITTVPDAVCNAVVFDRSDPRYVYIATSGGLFRSEDGGRNFVQTYYSTLPIRSDVRSLAIDPSDPHTGYIGTASGVFVSHQLRTGKVNDWDQPGMRTSGLAITALSACRRHPGHLYALVYAALDTINYGANGPEAAVAESFDGGYEWRILSRGPTQGSVQWLAVDPRDPDQVWVAFSRSIFRIERLPPGAVTRDSGPTASLEVALHGEPSMSEVEEAALKYQGVELAEYTSRIRLARLKAFLPRSVTISYTGFRYAFSGRQDDIQFAPGRYLQDASLTGWRVMGWATWALPQTGYTPGAVPMIRTDRVLVMNDELRNRIMHTIHTNYGELLRLKARLRSAPPVDLYTRVLYRLRIEQLEAIVNLASGNYLERRHKEPQEMGGKGS
jgi:hypothetical protein